MQDILEQLRDLQDSQMETALLRSCLSLPKVSFVLHSCPLGCLRDAISVFDNSMLEALSDLVGGPLPEWSWLKSSIPSSLGGLGICRASLHSSAAYISSLDQFRPLVARILGHTPVVPKHIASALKDLAEAAGKQDWATIKDIDIPFHQHHLFRVIDQASYDQLVARTHDSCFKALALSSVIHHAGDWLNVIPSQALGLHLYDQEFRLCLQYWLQLVLQMVGEEIRCPICQAVTDPLGDHQVGCGRNGDRIFQHDSTGRLILSCTVCSLSAGERSAFPDPWIQELPS